MPSSTSDDDDKSTAPGDPLRQIRIKKDLWNNAQVIAKALDSDRSALTREFWRWMTFEDGARMPRRPSEPPAGLVHADPLPAAIEQVAEGHTRGKPGLRPRYIVRVRAEIEEIAAALGNEGLGSMYVTTSPVQVSTMDRDHAIRILNALLAAGLNVSKA